MRWTIAESWAAATEVVALAYGVPLSDIRARSRGRGWRPREAARKPKKMAVYLTALMSEADYAAIGRYLDLHKDTIASHCAEGRMREASDGAEVTGLAMEQMVRAKLILSDGGLFADQLASRRRRLAEELRHLAGALTTMAEKFRASDEEPASSDLHPTPPNKPVDNSKSVVTPLRRAAA